jgi:hypothetical protein
MYIVGNILVDQGFSTFDHLGLFWNIIRLVLIEHFFSVCWELSMIIHGPCMSVTTLVPLLSIDKERCLGRNDLPKHLSFKFQCQVSSQEFWTREEKQSYNTAHQTYGLYVYLVLACILIQVDQGCHGNNWGVWSQTVN